METPLVHFERKFKSLACKCHEKVMAFTINIYISICHSKDEHDSENAMILDIFFLDPKTRMYYYLFIFLTTILLILKNKKIIIDEYIGINKKIWSLLLFIFVVGFVLRLVMTPMLPITSVSVWSHRNAAIFISENSEINPSLNPRGYSLLLSPLYSLTGDIVWSSHTFDILVGSLSIIIIFMLTYLLFKDTKASIISAIIIALLPWHIFFSGTHGIEIMSSFFIMLSMILIIISVRSKNPEIYFLACISILLNGLIKKEETILILILLVYFLYKKSPIDMRNKPVIVAYFFTGLLLIQPYFADIAYENFYKGQLGTTYLTESITSLLEMQTYNFHITTLIILSPILLYLLNKKVYLEKKDSLIFLLIFLLTISIPFMIHKKMHTRYAIYFLMPLIIFTSFTLSNLLRTKQKQIISVGLFILVVASAIYINIECPLIGEDCKYIYAQPLRWTDSKLPEIYATFNNENKTENHLIFIDPQSKNAFRSLYRDYPEKNIHTAWQLHNAGAIPILNLYRNTTDTNESEKYNIYLIEFEDKYMNYCNMNYYYEFCETMKDYKKEHYNSGDRYNIYKII